MPRAKRVAPEDGRPWLRAVDLLDEAAVLQLLHQAAVDELVGIEVLGLRVLSRDLLDDFGEALAAGVGGLRPDLGVRLVADVDEALVCGLEVLGDDALGEGRVLLPAG